MSEPSNFRNCDAQVEFSFTGSFKKNQKPGWGSQKRDLNLDSCTKH